MCIMISFLFFFVVVVVVDPIATAKQNKKHQQKKAVYLKVESFINYNNISITMFLIAYLLFYEAIVSQSLEVAVSFLRHGSVD